MALVNWPAQLFHPLRSKVIWPADFAADLRVCLLDSWCQLEFCLAQTTLFLFRIPTINALALRHGLYW
jgi:hypothetical protein